MEADPGKQRSRQKRRDRPLQLQQEKQTREEDEGTGHDDHDESPPRSSKDKMPRSKPKKGKSALFEEDIIDGFAIMSFTTLEELEIVTKKNGCVQNKSRAEEVISIKDTNSQDKDSIKTKKKKIKKSSPLNHFTGNCVDSNGNASDSNNSCALSTNSDSVGINGNNNNSSEVDANSGGGLVANVITRDHLGHQQHHCHRQQINSDQVEPQMPLSLDKLGDVYGLEKGDDKTSESVTDLYPGISVGGILNHLNNNGRSPCVALTAPTPPPSTSTTPTTLCNGIGGSTNPFHSPVHQVLVATTTTTTHTTTNSISRPNFTDSLTTSTVTAVTAAAALPSQSVINSSPYHPEQEGSKPSQQGSKPSQQGSKPSQQGSKPSQLSPGSSLSHNNSKRTLSPNTSQHHQNHDSNNFVSDNSSCARSLQYSRVHKPNHIQYKNKEAPQNHSPSSSNNQHQHNLQRHTPDNLLPTHLQNGPSNLNCQDPNQGQGQANSFSGHDHPPGVTYPHSPLIRPDPLFNSCSPHAGINSRVDPICCSGGSAVTNSVVTAASSVVTLPSTSTSHGHNSQEHHQHHGNNHHRSSSSSSSSKSHHGPHQNHKHSSRDRPASPCGHPGKRVCRTSPVGLPPAAPGTALTSAPVILNDASKHSAPVSPRCQGGKFESVVVSTQGRNERDHFDRLKPKEGSINSVISSSSSNHHHHHHPHHPHSQHHHSKDHHHRDREKDRERDKDREKTSASQGISLHSGAAFPTPKPAWPSAPGSLYSSLIQSHHHSPLTPSSSLHSLSSHSSSSVTSHASPLLPLPLAPPPPLLAAGATTLSAGMFAPPLHPAPPSLSSAPPLQSHPTVSGQFSAESLLRGQDYLHQDLNNRLLAHHDSSTIALPPSPYIRSETHQHQHQHLHNHMHQHTYGGLGAGSLVPPTPPLFDKIPKAFEAGVFRPSFDKIPKALEASVFRPNIVPSYSAAFASLLPPGPSGTSLASSLQGAFQPKNLVTPGQMLVSYRDREKAVPPPGLPPLQKKQGKWCAVHVRVAWEIYHRQQKKVQKDSDGPPGSSSSSSKCGPDTKPLEPLLRPASHLLPGGGSSARSSDSSLLSSVPRGLQDGMNHSSSSLLSSAAQLGLSPFPRPSPYPPPSLLNPLGFSGLGSSMFAPVHEMPPPGLGSSAHEWNRLHRTPSSFPSWPKSEAERDKDREKERERELRKEEENYRDRRGSINHHMSGLEDTRHADSSRPKSRSRSRSPLVNGRLDHHKSDLGSYDKRPLSASASGLKLKEERRDDELSLLPHHLAEREKRERERLEREKLERDRQERDRMERERMERERIEKEKLLQSAAVAEREKLIQAVEQREKFFQTTGYFNSFGAGLHTHPGLLDRRVTFMGHPGTAYPFLDRPPVPASMWNPFDKSAEFAHRLEVERERERIAMMSRLSGIPSHLAALEQERLKEQILREQQQEREYDIRRQYLERLPSFNADRLRAVDPLALGSYFPRTLSPMFGPGGLAGLKSNSPHGIPVAPPPLIHSSSNVAATMLSRSHDNSPSSSSKSKGCSPADSTSDLKDKRDGSSTDPDAHLR